MPNQKSSTNLKKTTNNVKEDVCISLIGPAGCGKSALLVKYLTKRFIGDYDPCYEGCWTKIDTFDNTDINIQIMDTYDEEQKNLEKYFKWSDLMILVYSITNKQSFLRIKDYLDSIFEIMKKFDRLNEKKFLKIILLGNKIDMERHRQVSKQEVDGLLRKYSNQRSPQLSTKFTDSTNTITNDQPPTNQRSASSSTRPTMSEFVRITHYESTSCEEYELVKNLINQIIREYKREKEAYLATINSSSQALLLTAGSQTVPQSSTTSSSSSTTSTAQATTITIPPPPPPLPIDTESITTTTTPTPKSKLNNFIIKSRGDKHPRGKSPKSSTQVITHDISPANMSIINANLISPATLSVATSQPLLSIASQPSSSSLGSHNQIHSSSSVGVCSPSTPIGSTMGLVGSSSAALITPNNNNSSFSSLSRIISDPTGGGNQTAETNSECGSTPPGGGGGISSGGAGSNLSPATSMSASIKKNSKFPFFTKILNKNN